MFLYIPQAQIFSQMFFWPICRSKDPTVVTASMVLAPVPQEQIFRLQPKL